MGDSPQPQPTSCTLCGGSGWYQRDVPLSHPDFGRALRCASCTDFLRWSGLNQRERALTFADITGDGPHLALRISGAAIVAQRAGFATVYGTTGGAKSVWACAITAGLCRAGIRAQYTHGKAVEQSLFQRDDDGRGYVDGLSRERIVNVPALVVDEAHAINWKNDWIAGEMSDIFDARFRRAALGDDTRQITVFVAQHDPREWAPDFLYSRMRSGEYAVPWPSNVPPADGVERGALRWPFCVDARDARPFLATMYGDPVAVDPRTGEAVAA